MFQDVLSIESIGKMEVRIDMAKNMVFYNGHPNSYSLL